MGGGGTNTKYMKGHGDRKTQGFGVLFIIMEVNLWILILKCKT